MPFAQTFEWFRPDSGGPPGGGGDPDGQPPEKDHRTAALTRAIESLAARGAPRLRALPGSGDGIGIGGRTGHDVDIDSDVFDADEAAFTSSSARSVSPLSPLSSAPTHPTLRPLPSGDTSAARPFPAQAQSAPSLSPSADPLDDDAAIPVLEPLTGLLPEGLRRGDCVSIAARDRAPDSLTLALIAGALQAGLWCAVVGVPELGVAALAGLLGSEQEESGRAASSKSTGAPITDEEGGVHAALNRLLLVPEPGDRWAQVVAALAEAVDVLLVRPPAAVPADVVRRIEARLRQGRGTGVGTGRGGIGIGSTAHGHAHRHGGTGHDARHRAALLVLGPWESARLVLRTAETRWTGLDGSGPTAGTGRLIGCRATVVAEGRAVAGRPRTARLWLPAADGTARRLDEIPAVSGTAAAASSPAPAPAPASASAPASAPVPAPASAARPDLTIAA